MGGAARWWLHGSLEALGQSLHRQQGDLVIRRGAAAETVEAFAAEIGAEAVYWNRRYEAAERHVDAEAKAALRKRGIAAESFNGHLLREPWTVATQAGTPFRIFTAYWRAAQQQAAPPKPMGIPSLRFHDRPKTRPGKHVDLADLRLEPQAPDWAGGMRDAWQRGEAGAQQHLKTFIAAPLEDYAAGRDRMGVAGTSRLSPYLRFGNISARHVWHAASASVSAAAGQGRGRDLDTFLGELGWREFWYHLLFHEDGLATRNLRPEFDGMPWRPDRTAERAWQRGLTGYPIVDAGMRELWTTGWMHNRVRMIAASFLIKHLLVDWRAGEAWFWDTLVDADAASNPANWQWVAGSGTDAAPYFRIFNPTLQGEKFDPDGDYVRRWVPELASLPAALIHQPWKASRDQLAAEAYPSPIVDHGEARGRALEAWRSIR